MPDATCRQARTEPRASGRRTLRGDFIWDVRTRAWMPRRLSGAVWQKVSEADSKNWSLNKYRVLLTRAPLGTVIWIPEGDREDPTRPPDRYDEVAAVLGEMGARPLPARAG